MILIDVNLFVYAFNQDDERHQMAKLWLEQMLSSRETILIPWQNVVGFTRIITLPFHRLSSQMVAGILKEFCDLFSLDTVSMTNPTVGLLNSYKNLVLRTDAYGKLAPDAFLAALAIENGAQLASNDKDFARFESEGLKWFNPLAS